MENEFCGCIIPTIPVLILGHAFMTWMGVTEPVSWTRAKRFLPQVQRPEGSSWAKAVQTLALILTKHCAPHSIRDIALKMVISPKKSVVAEIFLNWPTWVHKVIFHGMARTARANFQALIFAIVLRLRRQRTIWDCCLTSKSLLYLVCSFSRRIEKRGMIYRPICFMANQTNISTFQSCQMYIINVSELHKVNRFPYIVAPKLRNVLVRQWIIKMYLSRKVNEQKPN